MAAVLLGGGCAQKDAGDVGRLGIDPRPEVASLKSAQASFSPGEDGRTLWLYKAALEKEFLFHSSVSEQEGAPTGSGLQARVVSFRQIGNTVFLLEATAGHVVTHDLPAELVMAEFPVLQERGDALRLDFNAGMNRVYLAGNWWGSDLSAGYESSFYGYDLRNTFISHLSVDEKRVYIKQVGQVKGAVMGIQMVAPTLEVSYYLSPYHPDPSYAPLNTSDETRVRFFEVSPQFEETSGRELVRTTRWNFNNGPVTFYVSANTPENFREAVREGILYWNKALGREVVRAEIAPEGVTAPHPDYNVVQWVPWDRAGFAYADALMDPRSGEILHAQVYMTSVFAISGRTRARMLLRSLKEQVDQHASETGEEHEHNHEHAHPGSVQGLCRLDLARQMIQGLEAVLDSDADDAAILRVAQAYVRDVIAHEIGHTMGLRHNFAGSLAMNTSQRERDSLYAKYVSTGEKPDPRTLTLSSTVMDYLIFPDSVLLGAMYGDLDTALRYDVQAMRWGYVGRAMPRVGSALFCTDSQLGVGRRPVYADCLQFDSGANPLEWAQYSLATAIAQYPSLNVEGFLMEVEDRDAAETVEDAVRRKAIYPIATLVGPAVTAYASGMRWLKGELRSVQLEQQHAVVDEIVWQDLKEEVQAQAVRWADAIGGAASLVAAPFAHAVNADAGSLATHWTTELDRLLETARVSRFRGLDGREHVVSDAAKAIMRERLLHSFEYAERKLYEGLLKVHSGQAFKNEAVAEQVESSLAPIAQHFILARAEEVITGALPPKSAQEDKARSGNDDDAQEVATAGTAEGSTTPEEPQTPQAESVTVPTFRYALEVRTLAAQLLSAQLGPFVDWSEASRRQVRTAFDEAVKTALGRDLGDRSIVLENVQNRRLKGWISEQKRLRSMLN